MTTHQLARLLIQQNEVPVLFNGQRYGMCTPKRLKDIIAIRHRTLYFTARENEKKGRMPAVELI
jgi:hypothetical protein